MIRKSPIFCVACLLLAGCGANYGSNSGGNGGGSYAGQAQGVYSGATSTGYSFSTIVLPNDKFYGIYGADAGNSFVIKGMVTGQGTSGNDTYTANVIDYYNSGQTISATVTATDMPGSSINGTITENTVPATFTGTAPATPAFNFNAAASVSDISGTWTGTLLDGTNTTVTISATNNTLSGSSSGCMFTGTVVPDSSGKNFFDVSLKSGASPCAFPNQTATGVGVYYLLPNGVTHQLLAGATLSATVGTVFFAQR